MGGRLAEIAAEMQPHKWIILCCQLVLCFTYEAACAAVFRTLDECRTGLMYSESSCVEKHASYIENLAMSGNYGHYYYSFNKTEVTHSRPISNTG